MPTAASTPLAVQPPPVTANPEPDEYTAQWEALCADPMFNDLPYKVETDRHHRLLMSPAKNRHSYWQTEIARLLGLLLPHGKVLVECAVTRPEGIKVADVG